MILYLDSSSLVKIFVDEEGSEEVRRQVDEARWASTSVIAYPEARSAFARQMREGALSRQDHGLVKASLDVSWSQLLVLQVTDEIRDRAGDLAEAYALRGFDSVHLSSYLELARRVPRARFSSFDERLRQATEAATRNEGLPAEE